MCPTCYSQMQEIRKIAERNIRESNVLSAELIIVQVSNDLTFQYPS